MEKFVGKIAVVTGSSKGIGEKITKELVKRGLIVVGLSRNLEKLQKLSRELSKDPKLYTGKFYPLKCDVTKEVEIQNTFANIKTTIGPISILVNNAGIVRKNDGGDILDTTEEDFDVTFSTNAKAMLLCAKETMNSMKDNSTAGHIININSTLGHPHHKMHIFPLYTSSKTAARILSETLRREVKRNKLNIKISNISPGLVNTDMPREVLPKVPDTLERILFPEDVAKACISVLDTAPTVLISELTIVPIYSEM